MNKISRELAELEIEKWLEYKKVSDRKKEAYKDGIETLIDSVCEGLLVLRPEDHVLEQTLKIPIGSGDTEIKKLEFKPRIKISSVHNHLAGVKSSDGDGRLCAYIAALTSKPKDIIKGMDTEDYSVGQSIAVFFL